MGQQQICLSNGTYMPHMQISSSAHGTAISVYKPHMKSLQSTVCPGTLVYIHFTLAYTPEQICLPHCTLRSYCTTTVVDVCCYVWQYCLICTILLEFV